MSLCIIPRLHYQHALTSHELVLKLIQGCKKKKKKKEEKYKRRVIIEQI